jgi:hypothetical protein
MAAMIVTRKLGYRLTEVAKHLRRDLANVSTLMLRLANRLEGVIEINRR